MGDFDGFRALSFDCYGTLIDWETGIAEALAPWAQRHGLEADRLLDDFGATESAVESQNPGLLYPEVLQRVIVEIGAAHGVTVTQAEALRFGDSVGDWPAFADSPRALATLKERFKLVILSNVDFKSFSRSNERLGVGFDLILTAEGIGSYKPSPRNFEVLLREVGSLGIEPRSLLHVAQSLYHDHLPAQAAGLKTVWIDRRGEQEGPGATPAPDAPVAPDWTYRSLTAFAAAALE
jgi:2-haloalkanoic acid dehalogenase type II